jgi:hypothetical protein
MRFGLLYEAPRPFNGTDVDWQRAAIPHERALQSIEMSGKYVIPACRSSARRSPVTAAS